MQLLTTRKLNPTAIILSVALTIFCTFRCARAQDLRASEFDHAAEKHRVEVETLLTNKEAPRPAFPTGSADHETVPAALRNFPAATALLFYDYGERDGKLQIWLLKSSGIRQSVVLEKQRGDLEKAIASLRQALGVEALQLTRSPRRTRAALAISTPSAVLPVMFSEASDGLAGMLMPPKFRPELESVKHIIIVATGAIGTVPFSVLQPFAKGEYLIDRMSISYAPSLYELARNVQPWKVGLLPAVIVGDPDLKSMDGWEFPELKGAKGEATAVAELIKTKALLGKEATLSAISPQLREARLLYFATHGVADAEASLDHSFLALAAKQGDEGMWTMRKIEETYYENTQLAVLSACQTGLGQVYDGGIMHLARTFQVSGVPRVVMSLWRVDDEATADLMVSFIRQLQKGDPNVMPAEALRRAMVEVKGRRPEPRQWASFVLFGTPR
ncbi:MAG: hypothetical protein JWM21_4216 [Acidobacteria bacterium]|nr:hypothetical protein [Acidobacteriota bacterium]